jgi:hypothetical protein
MSAAKMTPGPERRLFSLADCDKDSSGVLAKGKYLKRQEFVGYFEEK